jgi:aromatic-L-amino-acid/L-tryptophan decarboxylase
MSADEMRALGYAAVDAIVEHMSGIRDMPAYTAGDAGALEQSLGGPPPVDGCDPRDLIATVVSDALHTGTRTDHPGMLAYVPNHPTFPGAVADFLAAGANVFAGSWQGGPGAAVVELTVLRWICELLGLDASTAGVIQSGGSMANLVGLAVARDTHLPGVGADRVAYVSSQSHSSVTRALSLLGIDHVREVPVDAGYRLRADELARAADRDRVAGLLPWCAVAAAGSTNTGAVDDLPAISAVCRERDLWLHVDGAYGGLIALGDRGRAVIRGLELADSLVLDAHKSLFVPLAAGLVMIRDGGRLERTFTVRPEYLEDAYRLGGVSFSDRGPELTRPFRALKLWMTIRAFGFERIRQSLDTGLELAELAATLIERSDRLDVVTGPWLGIVTFRSTFGVPALALVEAVVASGRGMISTTVLGGETVARLCVLGHRTRAVDVERVLEAAAAAG